MVSVAISPPYCARKLSDVIGLRNASFAAVKGIDVGFDLGPVGGEELDAV